MRPMDHHESAKNSYNRQ